METMSIFLLDFTHISYFSCKMKLDKDGKKEFLKMAKKQLVDFVDRLKESGIKVSFTKPKSEFFSLQKTEKHPTTVNSH